MEFVAVSQRFHAVAFCQEKKNLQIAAANSAHVRKRKDTRRGLDTFNRQKCKFTDVWTYSKLKQTFDNKTPSVFVGQFVGLKLIICPSSFNLKHTSKEQRRCPQISLI